jgi:tetratricopeptide (TPR) repeat protein
MKHVFIVALCMLVTTQALAENSLAQTFERGNRAFARGDYAASVEAYQTLIEAGVDDPDVSFNLASAHGALGHYGQAIRYFAHTLTLRPSDEAARAGEKRARDALGQRQALESGEAIVADRPPIGEALFGGITSDALAIVLLVGIWLFCAAAAALVYVRAEALRLSLGIATALSLAVTLAAGLGLSVKTDRDSEGARAVVLIEHAALREGPDELARLSRELPEGTSVRVLSREGGYARVRVGEREGYMRAADVGEI